MFALAQQLRSLDAWLILWMSLAKSASSCVWDLTQRWNACGSSVWSRFAVFAGYRMVVGLLVRPQAKRSVLLRLCNFFCSHCFGHVPSWSHSADYCSRIYRSPSRFLLDVCTWWLCCRLVTETKISRHGARGVLFCLPKDGNFCRRRNAHEMVWRCVVRFGTSFSHGQASANQSVRVTLCLVVSVIVQQTRSLRNWSIYKGWPKWRIWWRVVTVKHVLESSRYIAVRGLFQILWCCIVSGASL